MNMPSYAITISHQLGCGGSAIGQSLSKTFGIPFVDRDILKQVAGKLHMAEADLEHRDERLSSFWEDFTEGLYVAPAAGWVPQYRPSDRELFEMESAYIIKIARKTSAVILGRAGRCLLREHPRHVCLYVTADLDDRIERVSSLFQISAEKAKEKILENDRARAAYNRTFTKTDGTNAHLYDLCVNTSSVGLENAARIAADCVRAKLNV